MRKLFEPYPLASSLHPRWERREIAGEIAGAVASMSGGWRRAHQLELNRGGWHLHLPQWVIQQAGGWETFAEQFEQSWARHPELGMAGVVGFEIDQDILACPKRHYTLIRFREQEIPQ